MLVLSPGVLVVLAKNCQRGRLLVPWFWNWQLLLKPGSYQLVQILLILHDVVADVVTCCNRTSGQVQLDVILEDLFQNYEILLDFRTHYWRRKSRNYQNSYRFDWFHKKYH